MKIFSALLALAITLMSSSALAQTATSVSGLRMASRTTAPGPTSTIRFWYKSSDTALHLTLADNTTDDALAMLAASQTFTNKTLTAPVLGGSITGTYTLAGTPTITSPAISGPTLSGSAVGTYTLAGIPTYTLSSALDLLQTRVIYKTMENTTAAVTGSVGSQFSPYMSFAGRGWVSGASEVNRLVLGLKVLPDQGGGDGSEAMYEYHFLNGAATPGTVPQFRLWHSPASASIFALSGSSKNLLLGANTDAAGNISGAFITLSTGANLTFGTSGANAARIDTTAFAPTTDIGRTLGAPTKRWSVAYIGAVVASRPACAAADDEGAMMVVRGAGGAASTFQACMKSAADAYDWRTIYTVP